MGDLIPMADHAAARDALRIAADTAAPWCEGCPVRVACREVRECHAFGDDPEPDIVLHLVEPPDIIA